MGTVPLAPLPASYDVLLLDLDGCVWVGDEPTPRAVEAVAAAREAGKPVGFVTNDARHAPEDFVRRLWRLGFKAAVEEVVTVGGALQHALNEHHHGQSAYVVGEPAVHRHVADAGLRIVNGTDFETRAEVVVVAGHDRFDYDELRIATQAVLRGAELVGAGRDRTFPMPDGPWPATGAILAAVEAATQRTAETVGKPEAGLFRTALDRLGEGRALMVGDRLDADVEGARNAGIDAVLVLTGATSAEEAEAARLAAADAPAVRGRGAFVAVRPDLAGLVLS